jgi:hypothetical protein
MVLGQESLQQEGQSEVRFHGSLLVWSIQHKRGTITKNIREGRLPKKHFNVRQRKEQQELEVE